MKTLYSVICSLRDRARAELRRSAMQMHESRRYTSALLGRAGHRHQHDLDNAQDDQLHSAVNQAIHGLSH